MFGIAFTLAGTRYSIMRFRPIEIEVGGRGSATLLVGCFVVSEGGSEFVCGDGDVGVLIMYLVLQSTWLGILA